MNSKKVISYLIIICLILVVLVFLAIIIISSIGLNKKLSANHKINIGYEIFGNDYCEEHDSSKYESNVTDVGTNITPVGAAYTKWKCKICGHEDMFNNTGVPVLCAECAEITGRCSRCGKLIKK